MCGNPDDISCPYWALGRAISRGRRNLLEFFASLEKCVGQFKNFHPIRKICGPSWCPKLVTCLSPRKDKKAAAVDLPEEIDTAFKFYQFPMSSGGRVTLFGTGLKKVTPITSAQGNEVESFSILFWTRALCMCLFTSHKRP